MTIKACVIGHPIAHSLSPVLHGFWLDQYKIDGTYTRKDIAPENLETGLKSLISDGYAGLNVTIPHKQNIMPLLDNIDDIARKIGAVNTVVIDDQGKTHGTNTDAYGFIQNLKSQIPNWPKAASGHVSGQTEKTALILGAGGAARAVLFALSQDGFSRIHLSNRSFDKAQRLAQEFTTDLTEIIPTNWEGKEAHLPNADLLVNTTCLGMVGQSDLKIDLKSLKETAVICDIVYTPLITPLLQQAQLNGHPTVTGLGMLLHQAASGFEKWFKIQPTVSDKLEQHVLNHT